MQTHIRLLLALSMLGVAFSVAPTWHVARNPGDGCWPPNCEDSQVPLATPVVTHGERLFMIGDGAAPTRAYESTDGKTWRGFAHDARWGARYKASDASFAGALWRVGGFVQRGADRVLMNDAWRSVDGRRWERVLERAPWPARSGAHLVVFRDTLWLMGGEPNDGRMWGTTDGRAWLSRRTPSLPSASPQGVLVHRNALWILGHGAWDSATNDVWTSSDAATWTRVTANAPWGSRTGAGFAVMSDRLWVVGGAHHSDAWSSDDGRAWHRNVADMPGPPRGAGYSAVFQRRLWIIGGKTGGVGGTGFWDGVVYLE
jgi:hypothetical protein